MRTPRTRPQFTRLKLIVYSVLSTFLHAPEFDYGPLHALASTQALDSIEAHLLQRTLLAYYRLLQANRALPHTLGWSLMPLSQLIWTPHSDKGVLFLATRCYALQVGMSEGERAKLENEVLGKVSEVDCPVSFSINFDGTVNEVDGWVLPVFELDRVTRGRDALLEPHNFYMVNDSSEPIHPAELRYVTCMVILQFDLT